LVRRKLAATRSAAREAILDGSVEVGGVPAVKPATLVDENASVRLRGAPRRYVGRGGLKLDSALTAFAVDVAGRRALDVGASTGGFTDCLLQRGAASVVAVDVGYGQLAWRLRNDERVTVIERTNFRYADPSELGAPFAVVVADLSFISLGTVADQLRAVGEAETDYVLLVKPQFEVGKEEVGRGGIVRDPALHAAAIGSVAEAFDRAGVGLLRAVPSPMTGAKGNREFLVWGRLGPCLLEKGDVEKVTDQ
jgi:23S rRNA (cytidine1920-2'-O)/16S rRNA (cytidine1409-2'-O)-methyltransferase